MSATVGWLPMRGSLRLIRDRPEEIRSKPAGSVRRISRQIGIAAIDREELPSVRDVPPRPARPVVAVQAIADEAPPAVAAVRKSPLEPRIERNARAAILLGRQVEIVGHGQEVVAPGAGDGADAIRREGPVVRLVVPPE